MHSYIKYIRVFSLAVTILSFSFVSVSHAVDELFKSIDENTDGKINQKEFSKEMKDYIFNELDINNNKAISESEWISIEGVIDTDKHEKLFQRLDTDKDKRISFFEFESDFNRIVHQVFPNIRPSNLNASCSDD